jgi:NADPH:quinone reductase-like Zn-dependent oxidoreductase
VDVLHIAMVPRPVPGDGEACVEVVCAGINPGEAAIRDGRLREVLPATFPSGQGSDFAGRVVALGANVTEFSVGDEVIGYTDGRASHADYVVVPAGHLTGKPAAVDWEQAGGLYVAGTTAYAAVRAVALTPDDTVAISGAAGGVGSIASQLARRSGAKVIGIAGEGNGAWLESIGVRAIAYGEGLADRLRAAAPHGIDAFIDTFGGGYVRLAVDLGVGPQRIDTVIDFPAAAEFGAKTDGNAAAGDAAVLAKLASLIAVGELVVPIAASYPLEQVRDAYTQLAGRHARGKIVLRMR